MKRSIFNSAPFESVFGESGLRRSFAMKTAAICVLFCSVGLLSSWLPVASAGCFIGQIRVLAVGLNFVVLDGDVASVFALELYKGKDGRLSDREYLFDRTRIEVQKSGLKSGLPGFTVPLFEKDGFRWNKW